MSTLTDGSSGLDEGITVGQEPDEDSLSARILEKIDNEEVRAEVPDAVAMDTALAGVVPAAKVGKTKGELEVAAPEGETDYQPDNTYTAFGKQHEVPEMFQGLMKDAESEKEVKDLLSKAGAIDTYKENINSLTNDYQSLQGEHNELDGDVKRTLGFLQSGDLDNFFREVQLSREQVYDWVSQQLHLDSLGPSERQAYESQVHQRSQNVALQGQSQQVESRYQAQAVQLRELELDMSLQKPEWNGVASNYDSKLGRLGAFRDLVIEEGQRAYLTTGQDLPVQAAVQNVMDKFGSLIMSSQEAKPVIGQGAAVAGNAGVSQRPSKPVIPNAAGASASPVKRVPKSLDDLYALEREMSDAGL